MTFQEASQRITPVIQGEVLISVDPNEVFSTILGSCVAACICDLTMRIGGMNHFLLSTTDRTSESPVKYGAYAMELLINGLLKKGARKEQLVAKLFGGAAMSRKFPDIGGENAKFARAFLAAEGIPCISESLGGTSARRIRFWPTTGQAQQFVVPETQWANDPQQELARARAKASSPDVTLF